MSHTAIRSDTEVPAQAAERLAQEVSAMRDEMRQLHRLTVLGTAAATIAHEYNNLMTPVLTYAKYALDSGDIELMKKALTVTLKQTGIVTAMSRRVLGLAVDEPETGRTARLREVVEEAVACLCRDLTKDGITLKIDIPDDLAVQIDPRLLQQVLFNLLINARQAILGKSGRIAIEAVRNPDGHVALSVKDNGCGIPPDMLDRIFEPFATTKRGNGNGERSGVGLGLAICRDIVQENRGTISVASQVGAGTTFTLTFPVAV